MTFGPPLFFAVVCLLVSACLHDEQPRRERGAGSFYEGAPEIKAPLQSRCVRFGRSAARGSCDEARYLGQLYARKLAPGDEVCLEGGFGGEATGACLSRAAVMDSATDRVLLEIRAASPESRWFKSVLNQVWFEEGALVDLYLAEHGY